MLAGVALQQPRPKRPVVICGAGAAGIAAALAAARKEADVLLLEAAPAVGGTVANALIHTLGGLFDTAGELVNDGLPAELVQRLHTADPRTRRRKMGRLWVLQVCPHSYRQTLTRWLAAEPRITVLRGAHLLNVRQRGASIDEVDFDIGKNRCTVQPCAVVDATGSAAVAQLLGDSHLLADTERAAGGLIVRLKKVAPGALQFPKGVGLVKALRAAADSGKLPPECRHAWLDSGIDDDEAFVKLHVPMRADISAKADEAASADAKRTAAKAVTFLRQFPEFRDAEVAEIGSLGIRDGGRIRGRYILTADDVRQGRRFGDAVARGVWPIEYWHSERGVRIEHLPGGQTYDIPLACLQLAGIDNYFAAGKCLSADRDAHASARVAGTCWALGQAAGAAAAVHHASTKEHSSGNESRRTLSRDRAASAQPPGDHHERTQQGALVP